MRAMVLNGPGGPVREAELPKPSPGPGQVLIEVRVCGVCRTDLHIYDGELTAPHSPLVLGHQIVGTVVEAGAGVAIAPGSRVGVPWLGWTDGDCRFCRSERENLCIRARFTGLDIDGGYAEYTVADARYCLPLPPTGALSPDDARVADEQTAPLLCAGLIGYRALRMTGPPQPFGQPQRLGLYGFGASAHIICQVAVHEGRRVFAFTRAADSDGMEFARSLGAEWAGDSLHPAPEPLDAAIIFAPVGPLVPAALRALDRGGVVVCAGIHMSDIPSFPYDDLWLERGIRSVANLTRRDGHDFLALAPRVPVRTAVTVLPLAAADEALQRLRVGEVRGAIVLDVRR